VQRGHGDIVKWLVKELGANVKSKGKIWGWTQLSPAAANGRLEVMKFLVGEGSTDVKSNDNWRWTTLSLVSRTAIRQW